MNSAQEKEKQDQQEREKERIRVEKEIGKGKQLDSDIAILLSQNKLDEAIKLFEDAPAGIKSKISQQVSNDLKHRLQKRDSDDVENRKRQEDKVRIAEIEKLLQQGDLENAWTLFVKIHDKFSKDLPDEKRKQLQAYNAQKLEEEARIQKENSDKAKQEAKKKKRLKIVLFSSFLGILLLFLIGFFTTFPGFIWDADGDGYHTYLEDDCPQEKGTINGCPDSDKDGVPNNLDKCPKVKGNVNGCPDSDKDGVIDSDDKCPDKAGKVNGCPDTINDKSPLSPVEDVAQQDDIDSLLNNEAVTTPKNGSFSGQIVAGKWLRFKNKNYEYSDFKNKQFKPVTSQETVDLLNMYYELKGKLKQGVTTTPKETASEPPKKDGQIITSPKQTNSKTNTKGLTEGELKELKELQDKEKSPTPLNQQEREKKKELERKKG